MICDIGAIERVEICFNNSTEFINCDFRPWKCETKSWFSWNIRINWYYSVNFWYAKFEGVLVIQKLVKEQEKFHSNCVVKSG